MTRTCQIDIKPTSGLITWVYCEANYSWLISSGSAPFSKSTALPDGQVEFEVIAVGVTGATYDIEVSIDGGTVDKHSRTLIRGGRDVYRATI